MYWHLVSTQLFSHKEEKFTRLNLSVPESNSWLVCGFWFFVSPCLYVCISRSTAIVYSTISEMACAAILFALVRVPKHFLVSKVCDRKCISPGIVDLLQDVLVRCLC